MALAIRLSAFHPLLYRHWNTLKLIENVRAGNPTYLLWGLVAAAGEWCLVCLAYNLKRLHIMVGSGIGDAFSRCVC
jgi:hypothetical protein